MNAEPWMTLGGLEVGHALRTLSYLRRGLGGPTWTVHLRSPLLAEGSGLSDILTDTLERDPFATENLGCYCAAIDTGPFEDPATDDAPWYSADRPESANFLGFIPWALDARPSLTRVTQQGTAGAVVGPQGRGGWIVTVSGQLYGTTRASMRYGEAWLRKALAGAGCDEGQDLRILPACPDEGDTARFGILEGTGLVDGPTFGAVQEGVRTCLVQTVDFQLIAESPRMESDPTTLIDRSLLAAGSPQRTLAQVGEVLGDAALRITVVIGSGGPLQGLLVEGRVTSAGACPSIAPSPAWEFSAASIAAGMVLVVDGVEEDVRVVNPATGETIAGLDALDYDGLFPWPELAPCTEQCVTISATGAPGGTRLTVEQVEREG